MKRTIIILLMFLTAATVKAGSEQDLINKLTMDISNITAQNGVNTELDKLEQAKLSSLIQSLEIYERTLSLEELKTLYIAKTVLHSNWLRDTYGRDPLKLTNDNDVRISKLLLYMEEEKKDYDNDCITQGEREVLIEDVRRYILFQKDLAAINANDVAALKILFEYQVNALENTAPELRTPNSNFETRVFNTEFIQARLWTYWRHFRVNMDINDLLNYSVRLSHAADLLGAGIDKTATKKDARIYKMCKPDVMREISRVTELVRDAVIK